MNFYNYMMKNYRNSVKNKLAAKMHQDGETFPKNGQGKFDGWHRIIYSHLERHGASAEMLAAFEECWEEYVKCEKARLRKN